MCARFRKDIAHRADISEKTASKVITTPPTFIAVFIFSLSLIFSPARRAFAFVFRPFRCVAFAWRFRLAHFRTFGLREEFVVVAPAAAVRELHASLADGIVVPAWEVTSTGSEVF